MTRILFNLEPYPDEPRLNSMYYGNRLHHAPRLAPARNRLYYNSMIVYSICQNLVNLFDAQTRIVNHNYTG